MIAVILITVFEWPKMKQPKERIVFVAITSLGFVLAVLLLFNPEMPGPTQMIDAIFKPLGKLLEK